MESPKSNRNISWSLDVTTIMKLFNHDARKIADNKHLILG